MPTNEYKKHRARRLNLISRGQAINVVRAIWQKNRLTYKFFSLVWPRRISARNVDFKPKSASSIGRKITELFTAHFADKSDERGGNNGVADWSVSSADVSKRLVICNRIIGHRSIFDMSLRQSFLPICRTIVSYDPTDVLHEIEIEIERERERERNRGKEQRQAARE